MRSLLGILLAIAALGGCGGLPRSGTYCADVRRAVADNKAGVPDDPSGFATMDQELRDAPPAIRSDVVVVARYTRAFLASEKSTKQPIPTLSPQVVTSGERILKHVKQTCGFTIQPPFSK